MTIWAANSTGNTTLSNKTKTNTCSIWAIIFQYLNYITTTVDNSKNKVDARNQLHQMQKNRQSKNHTPYNNKQNSSKKQIRQLKV